jgi:hypothetical protein
VRPRCFRLVRSCGSVSCLVRLGVGLGLLVRAERLQEVELDVRGERRCVRASSGAWSSSSAARSVDCTTSVNGTAVSTRSPRLVESAGEKALDLVERGLDRLQVGQ